MQKHSWTAAMLLAAVLGCSIPTFPGPDVQTIVSRSVEVTKRDWAQAPRYACSERDRVPHGTKTYEDLMIEGSPYQKLIKVNGKPLEPEQEAEEKKKLQETIKERKSESPRQRKERVEKYEKERKRDHELMEELTKAFDFQFEGEQKLDGFQVYVLAAKPKPDYKPTSAETEVLKGMRGKIWIDTKTYQWVKVVAEVIHSVNIYGFVAKVEPGTMFELEKMPVGNRVWLEKHFSMRSHAKILSLVEHQKVDDETYFDCTVQQQNF